ncbi:MAG TPA: cation diffusion facilitator family transporter [Deltaproteobacteria bacterium]|jgi:cation diffusion facilitator family transporter|nr:cation diffusion facilitator family transporter [Deltaproteobacteria bacterium]
MIVNQMNTMQADREKIVVARLSVISNSLLIAAKLSIGLMMGSVSIISEAAHSGVDLLAAIIAFVSVRKSGKPADREHPFGHGKIENISGSVEAVLILLAAGWIIYEAVRRLIDPRPIDAVGWGVGVMLFSCFVNILVSRRLFRVGEKTDSVALKADAWHLMTDVYTSAGVMAGLFIIWIAETAMPGRHFHWIDPLAAIAVAILIMHAAWRLTVQSAGDLLDAHLPSGERTIIQGLIASKYPDVHGYHKLKTRKAGSIRFIEFHMLVEPGMSVEESHRITDDIARMISERLPNATVTIHVEPCDGRCDEECLETCMLPEGERIRARRGEDRRNM